MGDRQDRRELWVAEMIKESSERSEGRLENRNRQEHAHGHE